MKRIVIFLLVVTMLLGMVGCGEEENLEPTPTPTNAAEVEAEPMEVNALLDAYKRVEVSELQDDPSKFMSDLNTALAHMGEADLSEWTVPDYWPEDATYNIKEREVVLFNLPAVAEVMNVEDETGVGASIGIEIHASDNTEAIKLANSLCEYALTKYGDASSIKYSDVEITEHEWRESYMDAGNIYMDWYNESDGLVISSYCTEFASVVTLDIFVLDVK